MDSVKLNNELGTRVLIASETFQHTGSFKFRAAYNVALSSSAPHLVTASSGNFGQALAYACQLTGKKCTVVMPETSTKSKIEAVEGFGGEIRLVDVGVKSRGEWLLDVLIELGTEVESVSPYDDERVIEGNSTLADELVNYKDDFDSVIVPIGGGGLSAGLIEGFKRNGVDVKVFGAEPKLGNDAAQSLAKGEIVSNEKEPATIADGARTLSVGKHNFPILKSGLTEILEVEEDEIVAAMRLLFMQANLKCEPTGALSLAALMANKERFEHKKPLVIVSGGNVDAAQYAKLIATD
ncbi:pyridoxal-phosphate dependent enzyme [Candidatus Obscuribacterales bacterium]|nr:pyridoxal-phosphate dependent enzyme [Candidatus Obscuribacterales bacterium]